MNDMTLGAGAAWSRAQWVRRALMLALMALAVYTTVVDPRPLLEKSSAPDPGAWAWRVLDPLLWTPALMIVLAAGLAPAPRVRRAGQQSAILTLSPPMIYAVGLSTATIFGRVTLGSRVADNVLGIGVFLTQFFILVMLGQFFIGAAAAARAARGEHQAAWRGLVVTTTMLAALIVVLGKLAELPNVILVPYVTGTIVPWALYVRPSLLEPEGRPSGEAGPHHESTRHDTLLDGLQPTRRQGRRGSVVAVAGFAGLLLFVMFALVGFPLGISSGTSSGPHAPEPRPQRAFTVNTILTPSETGPLTAELEVTLRNDLLDPGERRTLVEFVSSILEAVGATLRIPAGAGDSPSSSLSEEQLIELATLTGIMEIRHVFEDDVVSLELRYAEVDELHDALLLTADEGDVRGSLEPLRSSVEQRVTVRYPGGASYIRSSPNTADGELLGTEALLVLDPERHEGHSRLRGDPTPDHTLLKGIAVALLIVTTFVNAHALTR